MRRGLDLASLALGIGQRFVVGHLLHQRRNLCAKCLGQRVRRYVGVFDHVMKGPRGHHRRVGAGLGQQMRHLDQMVDIGLLARTLAALGHMLARGKI